MWFKTKELRNMKFFIIIVYSLILSFHSLTFCDIRQTNITQEAPDSLDSQHLPPCVFVMFGATGDLTARKLMPAIYHLACEGHLSDHTAIVGLTRHENTHASFRNKMRQAVDTFSRIKSHNPDVWNQLKDRIFHHCSEFEDDQSYVRLKQFLDQLDQEFETKGNRIYYLATQPSYFPTIVAHLKKHQLIYETQGENEPWSRVIIEKPFGYDLNSAMQLQQDISQCLAENQTYRIDHYLGKEGVQNLLALRFENGLFEPLWDHRSIDNIQITLAEDIGIGSRARFWEETGALRDLLQNHLMQLLAIVAMEPPADLSAESIRKEKIRVLETIRPFPILEIEDYIIRGQYGPGSIQNEKVLGYREEKGVSLTSAAETFIAVKLFIDNARWKGVPIYIRGGKRLAKSTTEIAITFKKGHLSQNQESNVLFIRIQPHAGIFLKTISKVPGFCHRLQPVVFGYKPDEIFRKPSPDAYERMIFDCIKGNCNLFVSAEEQIAAWRLLTPVLNYWKEHVPEDFPNYESGAWGPQAADEMLFREGHQWHLLEE